MKFLKYFSLLLLLQIQSSLGNDFGSPDPSIPELKQFEYLLGSWDVKMELRQEDGSFLKLDTEANVKAYFHQDGKSLQTIFSTNKGGFTTDIRTFNLETKKWQVLFMNAKAQRWHGFEASLVDGKMTTLVEGGDSGQEEYVVKIIDGDISADSFTKEIFHSRDDGDSWTKVYIMNFKRAL